MLMTNDEEQLREKLAFTESMIPERISADPEIVENGLAKLVLSIIDLVRRLLEKQALRRMIATGGTRPKAAISTAALAATIASSTQNARELHGSSANHRSIPCVRYPRSRSCFLRSSTDGSATAAHYAALL